MLAAMSMPRDLLLRRLVMVVAWLLATALAGVLAWTAVSRLGREGTTAARPLSASDVRARLSRASAVTEAPRPAAASAMPRSTPRATATTSTPPTAPGLADPRASRSWQLAGGTLAVACRGVSIELLYASPLDGWVYQVDPQPPRTITVEFSSAQRTVSLSARCRNGSPVATMGARPVDAEGNGGPED